MAKLVNPFNVATTDISQAEFGTVPAGDYKVVMYESEVRPVKDNNNSGYVAAKYRIIEGDHTGVSLRPDNINIYNQNPIAAKIGAARLAAIATAVGLGNATLTDTAELHNKPFMVRVVEKENSYVDKVSGETKHNKQNEITTILGLDGNPPRKGAAQAHPQPAQAQQPPQMAPQGGGLPTGTGMPPGFGQPAQQPQQAPQQPMQPAGGAPSWANPPMGNGMPPQQAPQQPMQPAGNWGNAPANAWGGPQG